MATLISIDFETPSQAALFLEHGGLPALGVTLELTKQDGPHIEYQGELSTRLWDGCREYVEECGGTWTAVSTLDAETDSLSLEEEIKPEHWTEETTLHTPTFEALLKADGTLWLTGPALHEGFSVERVQALTRFLSERVKLPPIEPPYDFSAFTPRPVEE